MCLLNLCPPPPPPPKRRRGVSDFGGENNTRDRITEPLTTQRKYRNETYFDVLRLNTMWSQTNINFQFVRSTGNRCSPSFLFVVVLSDKKHVKIRGLINE